MHDQAKAITIVAVLPVAALAIASLIAEVPQLFDPCVQWGEGARGSISPDDVPCSRVTGVSETKRQAVGRLVLVQGSALVASALALIGAFSASPYPLLIGSALLFLISLPLFLGGASLVTLFASGMFLWAFKLRSSFQGKPLAKAIARLMGTAAGIGATLLIIQLVTSTEQPGTIYFLLVLGLAMFIAVSAWSRHWPPSAEGQGRSG